MLKQIKTKIIGIAPLLVHNGQTADPLNYFSKAIKEISSKRKKTDGDYEKMADIEWHAGLYVNEDNDPIIPGTYLEGALLGGAKLQKLGRQSKAGAFVEEDPVIEHDGPKDIKKLAADMNYRDTRGVRVGTAKVMRTRPIFRKWALSFVISFNDEVLQIAQIKKALEDAGQLVGIGDFRPKYGRFVVEAFELQK